MGGLSQENIPKPLAMNPAPAITVLMTVYNGERFLREAIRSILSQDFHDYEFLIVDDASSDGSVSILKEFAESDSRIRLITNRENKGQTVCLNQGLREARGRWIARQDADDLSLPNRLQSQYVEICKTPDLMIIGVNGWVIDEFNHCTGMIHVPLSDGGIRWSLPFRNPFIHAGVLFKRVSSDGEPVFYDETFKICQDWELWGRLMDQGVGMNLPERLVAYRHQESSLSRHQSTRTRDEAELITGRLWQLKFPEQPSNQRLLASFRDGLNAACRRSFWLLYREVRNRYPKKYVAEAEAVHRVQAAGSLASKKSWQWALEILEALKADPCWTISTIMEGIFRSRKISFWIQGG